MRPRPRALCRAQTQWASLYALLDTSRPAELTVPARLQPLLSGASGGDSDRQFDIEIIPTAGGPVFDPLKATEVGAVQTLNALLPPERLNRLESQHSGRRERSVACAAVRLAAWPNDGADRK